MNKLGSVLLLAMSATMTDPALAIETTSSTSKDHEDVDTLKPAMKTFGFDYNLQPISGNADFGIDTRASFDLGAAYELPFYTQEQYYIGRQRIHLYVGGRQSVTVTLWPLRFSFYLDLWPFRMIFENYFSVDILGIEELWCWYGS